MNNIIYTGPFKDHIKNYIELKKAVGYKYDTEAEHLKVWGELNSSVRNTYNLHAIIANLSSKDTSKILPYITTVPTLINKNRSNPFVSIAFA